MNVGHACLSSEKFYYLKLPIYHVTKFFAAISQYVCMYNALNLIILQPLRNEIIISTTTQTARFVAVFTIFAS